MKVLIATDGSRDAISAMRTAIRLLNPADREIDLLCVAPRASKRQRDREQYERRILRETTHILKRARACIASERAVNLVTEVGSPARSIVEHGEEYDLTVIGPKGAGAAQNAGLGLVASRVVSYALAPLLVARDLRSEGGLRALIAVDGSTACRHAIDTFTSLFDLNSAEVCLMHVAETPWIHLGLDADWVSYDEEDKERSEAGVLEKEMIREGDAIIEAAREQLRPFRLSVTTRMEDGNPAEEILSEADRGQYDLIVAGATGTRDLKHMMLGSVSAKIAWDASASVLIVREPD